jgi:hypothetical protein
MRKQNSVVGMPAQYLKSTKKTPKWGRDCVNGIKAMASSQNDMGRSSKENKKENYDLVNSIFDPSNMEHVVSPYGIDSSKYGGTATKMQNYNIIRSRLETLRGEEMNSPLNFFVYAIAGEAVSAKKQKKIEKLKELMRASIIGEFQLEDKVKELEEAMAQLQETMKTVQDQEKMQQLQQQMQQVQQQRNSMPDIVAEMKKFNSTYVDPTEQTNNKILKYLKREDKLSLKFNQGWFHGLVSAEEVYYTGIIGGHPTARPVNPLQFEYDKGADTTFIHKGNWGREEFWLPASEVIDMVGDVLTDAQTRKILDGKAGHSVSKQGMHAGFGYNFDGGQTRDLTGNQGGSHVYVMRCAWRSARKVGILKYPDERSGKMQTTEVDDTFKLTQEFKDMGAVVTWEWETEIWEGMLIGDDIYVNVRPKNNQTKNLPYIGFIYNNVNSVATSMVDLVKAHQYTYIIIWWRLEQEIAKAKGKKFIMDMAQLPKSQGWDVDQWMYYFENMGVIWINSKEEGRKGDPTSTANFNQFNSVDMSLSQVVGQYMEIIKKLESLVEDIMGVSPQRMGDVGASETATGAQTAISRSTNVTKPWFYFHDLVKEEVLTELLELAKIAYMDGTELQLFLSEFEIETLKIDGDMLNASDMAVFVTNTFEDRSKKDKIENLISAAVAQGKASLLDAANAIDSDSMSYMKAKLEEGEKRAQENAQADSKARQESEAAERELKKKESELERAAKIQMNTDDNNTDILIKKMDIGSSDSAGKADMELLKMANSTLQDDKKLEFEQGKENTRSKEKQQELKQKKEDANSKKQS